MTTAVVQIGNSDDKLSQARWAAFCLDTQERLMVFGQLHFAGNSGATQTWQNACYVLELADPSDLGTMKNVLSLLAERYDQDSIAVTLGKTEFVAP